MQKDKEIEKPLWLKRDFIEVEALVIKFAKQGISNEKIGSILRDSYGIPKTSVFNAKITEIIKKAGINQEPQDLSNLKLKVAQLEKHTQSNKQDKVAKRSLQITKEKSTKFEKYYKKKGILK